MTRTRFLLFAVAAATGTTQLAAQSFVDLVDSRNPAQAFAEVFLVEAGAISTMADGRDRPGTAIGDLRADRGLGNEISWDGRAYYRNDQFGSRRGTLEAYAGRDGLFAGFTDGKLVGDDTVTRFEFHGRPWVFYRDGFYVGDQLRRNGFYEGSDYEGYLGFGRKTSADGLYVEFGPYYRQHSFRQPDHATLLQPDFVLPDDYAAYGGRLYVEQRAVHIDRRRAMPTQGYVLTLVGEREWNDNNETFGRPVYQTDLPNAVWRARGRLEWYLPGGDAGTFEVFVNGGWHDEKDRLQNTDGSRPLGNQWGDGQLRLRMNWANDWTVTPFVQVQYSRVLDEFGIDSKRQFFLGAGLETYLHFGKSGLSLHSWYSYMPNDNRPSVRIDRDVHAEHMFYVGMVWQLSSRVQ